MTGTFTFEEVLYAALDTARNMQADKPSREQALVITKLEEATMWNDAKRVDMGLPALGLRWRS